MNQMEKNKEQNWQMYFSQNDVWLEQFMSEWEVPVAIIDLGMGSQNLNKYC